EELREIVVEHELVDRREVSGHAEVEHLIFWPEETLEPVRGGLVVVAAETLDERVAEERDPLHSGAYRIALHAKLVRPVMSFEARLPVIHLVVRKMPGPPVGVRREKRLALVLGGVRSAAPKEPQRHLGRYERDQDPCPRQRDSSGGST